MIFRSTFFFVFFWRIPGLLRLVIRNEWHIWRTLPLHVVNRVLRALKNGLLTTPKALIYGFTYFGKFNGGAPCVECKVSVRLCEADG